MSEDDATEDLPTGPPRDTNPMLERILEELRGLRDDARSTRSTVDELRKEIIEFRADMVDALDDVDRSLAAVQGDAARRYSRLEQRVQTLENPQPEP